MFLIEGCRVSRRVVTVVYVVYVVWGHGLAGDYLSPTEIVPGAGARNTWLDH